MAQMKQGAAVDTTLKTTIGSAVGTRRFDLTAIMPLVVNNTNLILSLTTGERLTRLNRAVETLGGKISTRFCDDQKRRL